jgi:hypothetical protein
MDFRKSVDGGRYTLADVHFLSDLAPVHLLYQGSRFALMEGAKRVAKGVIVAPSTPIPDHLSEFEASLIG